MEKNPFVWSPTAKSVNLPVMQVKLKEKEETVYPSNLSLGVDIFVAHNRMNFTTCLPWVITAFY